MTSAAAPLLDALAKNREARDELRVLVIEARRAGMSLRKIATATGLSHETVRRLSEPA